MCACCCAQCLACRMLRHLGPAVYAAGRCNATGSAGADFWLFDRASWPPALRVAVPQVVPVGAACEDLEG